MGDLEIMANFAKSAVTVLLVVIGILLDLALAIAVCFGAGQ